MASTAQQTWSPEQYAQQARFVSDLGLPVVELLAPRAGERILDLGCGDGALTKTLVELGCQVVGVDASPAMVAAARALEVDARVMDGQCLPFAQEFDAVFSNAALHWMPQLDAVLAGVWRALKPGGRFVGECGGAGNTATVVQALTGALRRRGINAEAVNPWHFPTLEEYRITLEAPNAVARPPGGVVGDVHAQLPGAGARGRARRMSRGSGRRVPCHAVRRSWPVDGRLCAPALCCYAARVVHLRHTATVGVPSASASLGDPMYCARLDSDDAL
jgi:SAM-dependent methyltransferase